MGKICDSHVHSDCSFDARDPVEKLALAAVKKGISSITVTDHCEAPMVMLGDKSKYGHFDVLIPKSIQKTEACRKKYQGRLDIYTGLELGEPLQDPTGTSRALSYGAFDFVLASVHNLQGEEDFYYLEYTKENVPVLLNRYFDELLMTADFPHFDSLAHLTYPLRYIAERTDIQVCLSDYAGKIDGILKKLAERQKALEVNTSGYFKKIGAALPDESIVKRFKELGGKYVTLGSDAHSAEALGQGLDKGMSLIRNCGFQAYTIFSKHRPVLVDL